MKKGDQNKILGGFFWFLPMLFSTPSQMAAAHEKEGWAATFPS